MGRNDRWVKVGDVGNRGSSVVTQCASYIVQPKKRYRMTPGVRHSDIVN